MSASADRSEPPVALVASRIAHDIRSPMGVILGVLDELSAAQDSHAPMLVLARRSAGKLEWLARRMDWLAVAIAAPDQPLVADAMPVGDMVRMAAQHATTVGSRRAVSLSIVVDGSGPNIAQGSSWRHVCEELLLNALRHAKSTVEIRVHPSAGDHARVSVEDDGGGLARGREDELYAPPVAPRKTMGLWLAQRLTTRAGGKLCHEPGVRGARFLVDVPVLRNPQQ